MTTPVPVPDACFPFPKCPDYDDGVHRYRNVASKGNYQCVCGAINPYYSESRQQQIAEEHRDHKKMSEEEKGEDYMSKHW